MVMTASCGVGGAVSLRRRRPRLRQHSVKRPRPEPAPRIYSKDMLQVRLPCNVAAERDRAQPSLPPSGLRLLSVLAARPGRREREAIAARLWRGGAGPAPRASLRTAVWA